jgi:hypothetical protein
VEGTRKIISYIVLRMWYVDSGCLILDAGCSQTPTAGVGANRLI